MDVIVGDKRVRLDPAKSVGKGGEADIYQLSADKVLKIFKSHHHPDLAGSVDEQQAAKNRLAEHQKKLLSFPKNLPSHVITPMDLATNIAGNQIVGYSMRYLSQAEVLLRYTDKLFRQAINPQVIPTIFLNLHQTVEGIHKAGVVIGDFNNLNVLVEQDRAFVIDSDSFQFPPFLCRAYTERYLDPTLCNPKKNSVSLTMPYQANSDWYAYAVMLMECLLYVGPYGGVHVPSNPTDRLTYADRVLKRITVFNPQVRYPKPAIPYNMLPDELLQNFTQIFEKDNREVFPKQLLQNLRWTKCVNCGTEHARNTCPNCKYAQVVPKTTVKIRGQVTATSIFTTNGVLLNVKLVDGKLKWIVHESSNYKNEAGVNILSGSLLPKTRVRIAPRATMIGYGSRVLNITQARVEQMDVDTFAGLPMLAVNSDHKYWLSAGQLKRDGLLGDEVIGEVLPNQTLFWVGPKFGLGFYQAGEMSVGFVFDANKRGLNDSVKLPRISGQLVDANCEFSGNLAWLMLSVNEKGKLINRCLLISQTGEILAEANSANANWLSSIKSSGAVSDFLLTATDDGIVRVERNGNQLQVTKEFPDTEPFVDSQSRLIVGNGGLYVMTSKDITFLKLS